MASPKQFYKLIGDDLLTRLSWFTVQPEKVIAAGRCLREELAAFYPAANFSADKEVDLLTAHFCADVLAQLRGFQRQLREEGLLLLTAFGPDTLQELNVISHVLPKRIDMHDLGDALIEAGFLHPVMEVEHYTLCYQHKEQLLSELNELGILSQTLSITDLDILSPSDDGKWRLTFEVVFGHAFAGSKMITRGENGEVRVSVEMLRR